MLRRHVAVLEDQLRRIDALVAQLLQLLRRAEAVALLDQEEADALVPRPGLGIGLDHDAEALTLDAVRDPGLGAVDRVAVAVLDGARSEEHTSELQSLMRISYAVFCLQKKKHKHINNVYKDRTN